jgi:hypothetical protein
MRNTLLSTLVLLALTVPGMVRPASATATCDTSAVCGLNGTADGLRVVLDGQAGGPCFVQEPVTGEGTLRSRFWIQPAQLVGGPSQTAFTIHSVHDQATGVAVARVDLVRLAGGTFRVRAICRRNNGTFARTTLLTLGSGSTTPERELELELGIGGGGTGFCRLTRFGGENPVTEVTGIPNDDFTLIRARLGAVVGIDAGLSGTLCLDELTIFR